MMIRIIRYKYLLLLTTSLFFMGLNTLWAEGSTNSTALPKRVARVNGLPIYETALTSEMKRIADKGWTTGMSGNSLESINNRKSKALDTLITNELLRQASKTQPLEDIDNKVSKRILEMQKKYPSEKDFVAELKRKNKTIDTIRTEARDDIQLQEYLNKIKYKDLQISDSDVEKFYNNSKKNFYVPEKIKVRHILVSIDGSSTAQVEKALKKATELRERVIKQKNFAEVAKELSSCSSAANGGELEYISQGYMPIEFDKVAFSLKIGEISAPVKTRHGFHIIEVLDKKAEHVQPLTEVKEFITTYLKQQSGNERMKDHIVELKNKAKIEIVPD